jgi:hypothetical protein
LYDRKLTGHSSFLRHQVAILDWLVVFVLGRLAGCPEKKTDHRLLRCTSYMFADFWLGQLRGNTAGVKRLSVGWRYQKEPTLHFWLMKWRYGTSKAGSIGEALIPDALHVFD